MPAAIAAPAFEDTDLNRIIQRYFSQAEITQTHDAYDFAVSAHDGVFRKSGEPYVTHPLEVARILADLHMDGETLCAALLHDVIEDTDFDKAHIASEFSEVIADLVDGVTKLAGPHFSTRTEVSEASFQKMMIAMTHDHRVVLIKLADRLHNMRTLGSMPAHKKRRIAKETLEIHAPLARRMGMNALRTDLQMLCMEHLHPWRYHVIQRAISYNQSQNQETYDQILNDISGALSSQQIRNSTFLWDKNIYSMYENSERYRAYKSLSAASVSVDIRILVNKTQDCYLALGIIHQLYTLKVGKFRDFIAARKSYGFQALQTELITYDRLLLKVSIQTNNMYRASQYGVTTYQRYPESMATLDFNKTYLDRWIKQVADIQDAGATPSEFMIDVKSDLLQNEIEVYTPRGDIKMLPTGSTPIDFAYEVHTDVGNHCKTAVIDNHLQVPLNTPLKSGDVVRIYTDDDAHPHPAWLNYVVTGKARSAIRLWLNRRKQSEYLALGEQLLSQALKPYKLKFEAVPAEQLKQVLSVLKIASTTDLFKQIAQGEHCSKLIARRLADDDSLVIVESNEPVIIKSTEGLAVELQNCCFPIPGDIIVANLEKDQGLAIHRSNCTRLRTGNVAAKPLNISWAADQDNKYCAALSIIVSNRIGALSSVSAKLEELDINVEGLNINGDSEAKTFDLIIEVNNTEHLNAVAQKLNDQETVMSVSRPVNHSHH